MRVGTGVRQSADPRRDRGLLRMGQMTALRKRTGGVRHRGRRDFASFSGAHNSLKFGRRVQDRDGSTPVRPVHTIRLRVDFPHSPGTHDLDPEATVMSVDGVGAFDLISRASMLSAMRNAPGCDDALPFVLQFYGQPSSCIWEDEMGEVHDILQGKGGEQGDPLMPALFALGQHEALEAIRRVLLPSEKLLAFLG